MHGLAAPEGAGHASRHLAGEASLYLKYRHNAVFNRAFFCVSEWSKNSGFIVSKRSK